MIYLLFTIITIASLVFLLAPFIKGSSSISPDSLTGSLDKEYLEQESMRDQIESSKLSLRDLDLEHKIGKIASDDFEILKNELLLEWKSAETSLKKAGSKKKKST